MLYKNNKEYTAKALSYIPADIETIHWDEYYKLGREGASTPLRFFLNDAFLRWALWLTTAGLLIYIFFQMKRRQRIIPVVEPVRNTTLDFVDTVSSVYFSQHDNNSIAAKKIQFWYDHIRTRYYLSPQNTDEAFIQQLQRKSGVSKEHIQTILQHIKRAEAQPKVTDDLLVQLSSSIDEFYQLSKKMT
jgi:predicted nucleic acid-binding protein